MKRYTATLISGLIASIMLGNNALALTTYFGTEQYGVSLTARTALDTQQTSRSSSQTGHSFSNLTVDGLTSLGNPQSLTLADGSTVAISARDFTGSVIGALTASSPVLSISATLQDGSPRPQSNPFTQYRNENIGSASSRNAILFDFSEPFASFGGWFGDIETRQDGSGTNANYYLIDASLNILYQGILPSSTPLASQVGCGGGTNGCGNKGSRWIGFSNDTNAAVKYVLVVVGDDDGVVGSDGNSEHLSFYGGKIGKAYPDLWITKSATGSYISGNIVTWTITFGNSGYINASNVTISDLGGINSLISSGVIRTGTLNVGETQTMSITGIVQGTSGDIAYNSVTINYPFQELSTGNNSATGSVPIIGTRADIGITKTVSLSSAQSGQQLSYTLHYFNNGPHTAENVIINDSLPTGFLYQSHNTGLYIGNAIQLMISSLVLGMSGSIMVTGIIQGISGDIITNQATISSSTIDSSSGNNTGTITTTILPTICDLWINKIPHTGSALSGDSIQWIITYGNNGPDLCSNVIINELGGTGSNLTPSVLWSGTLGSGQTGVVSINETVQGMSGTIIYNNVSITTTTNELTTGNNSSTNSVSLYELTPPIINADVQIIKTSSHNIIISGSTIIFTLTYSNNGPTGASNVIIQDILPSGFTSLSLSTGTLIGNVFQLIVPWLGTGQTGIITIQGTLVGEGGSIVSNTATITTSSTGDAINNNTSSVTISILTPAPSGGGGSFETCGDGIVQGSIGEQCDDGNTNDTDGCNTLCKLIPQPYCGDGLLQISNNESCDDGNNNNNDGCTNQCIIELPKSDYPTHSGADNDRESNIYNIFSTIESFGEQLIEYIIPTQTLPKTGADSEE
ncbi:MAG TPA: DUF4215 domain-containing protein [Candidatus Absconditabacterales bacterium]|nr:DUF4215 domain-containing protein [Candidatus Absconditabacterales bacterium]